MPLIVKNFVIVISNFQNLMRPRVSNINYFYEKSKETKLKSTLFYVEHFVQYLELAELSLDQENLE